MTNPVTGKFTQRTFSRREVTLDGSSFENCRFEGCTLSYNGGVPPSLSGCHFEKCSWQFGNDAANTIGFLSGMYNGGFDDLIEATFHEIRKGAMITQQPAVPNDEKKAKPTSRSSPTFPPLKIFRIPKK